MALAIDSIPPLPPDPLQLRRRLALQGGSFAVLLLAAFSSTLYWDIAHQRAEDQRTELRQLAASAAVQLPLIAHEIREAESRVKFHATPGGIALPALDQQRLQWFDASGALLSEQGNLPVPALPPPPAEPRWQHWRGGVSLWQPVDRSPSAARGGSRPQRLGYVRVALSDRMVLADLARLQHGLLLGCIVSALAALLVGRRMLRNAFLPLQRQVSALQRFTADASHELRHPLTVLRTLLAAVPEHLRQQPALGWRELDATSQRLGQLLDDLLLIASQEQAGLQSWPVEGLQTFDLLELLEDLVRCYGPQAAACQVHLALSPDPAHHTIPIQGQSEALLRLFTNLLLNAIRHSPEGGTVANTVTVPGRSLRVAVVDQGPGIPAPHQEQVFERFWSGADRGGSSGLGLAISRAIARRHGGDLRLGESRPGRCELLVELPAAVGPTS
jgi:OmpR-family two-component system manganese-sensing sensor histidine kinase